MFLIYFISYGCNDSALVFLGGAEASASPSFALPMFITIKKIIILHLFLGVPAATVGGTGTPWHTRGYAPDTEYNQQWNVFSAFNPSKCMHTLGAVSRRCGARGAVFGVWCLAQGCHLSRGWFLPELRFEPTTSGYKSNALSIRPRLPCTISRFNSKFQISNKIWNELTNECCFLCSNSVQKAYFSG